ncbi:MAG: aquaporin [Pyrinomonadaceae bacterium]
MRKVAAEFVGTAFLLAAVVGSGIMGERLAGGSAAIMLLANTLATGAALVALILTFGPISGAHFNPAVSIYYAANGGISWSEAALYSLAQICGGLFGVGIANLMFDLPVFFASTKMRTGASQWLGEFVATFGLVGVIALCSRLQGAVVMPFAVAAYITAAYWFTSSTSFANPAITIARAFSDTFVGIRPVDAPGFIVAQLIGAFTAIIFFRWLVAGREARR